VARLAAEDAVKRKRRARKKRESSPPTPAQPSRRPRGGSIGKWTLIATLGVVALAAAAFLFGYPITHGPGAGRDVELVIPGDESPDALAGRLAAAGIVSHPRLFAAYLRVTGGAARAARGAHILTDDLTPRELVARLERSPFAGHARVTFPEGWTRFEMARRLAQSGVCTLRSFLDATIDPDLLHDLRLDGLPSAEGFLFPATYDLPYDADAKEVVRKMKTEFDRRWSIGEGRHGSALLDLGDSLGWGMRQVVTLASMVEKEAVADDERPLIASVFVNRLRDPAFTPKLLQCDPTAGYGCLVMPGEIPSCASYTGKITHEIVADPSNPYNTYKHEGLPPGPISNPGMKSLEAAMAPPATRWLYFVAHANGDGRSTFSETYAAHASAVRGAPKP
jgi:peptidoglycan lytic transglycosylase G